MSIKTFLENHFNQEINLTKTSLGLTNIIYTTTIQGEKVAVRTVNEKLGNSKAFSNEKNALSLVKPLNLDAQEIYYDPTTRLRITRWIHDAQEFSEFTNKEEGVIRVAKLLKKLHQANLKSHCPFNALELLQEYKDKIITPLFDYSQFDFILEHFKKIDNPQLLCHNDVVSGNILFTDSKDYLIDYEYSKDNDPLFDVMSFFTENKITEDHLRSLFYNEYFSKPLTPKQQFELLTYEQFHNYLWCCWANMMFDLLQEEIYLQIANDKYEALCACTKK